MTTNAHSHQFLRETNVLIKSYGLLGPDLQRVNIIFVSITQRSLLVPPLNPGPLELYLFLSLHSFISSDEEYLYDVDDFALPRPRRPPSKSKSGSMSLPLRIVLTAAIALIAPITFVAATTRIRPSTARSAHWAGPAAELREVASIRNRENVPRGRLRVGAELTVGAAESGLSGDCSSGDRQGRRRAHLGQRGRSVRPVGRHTGTFSSGVLPTLSLPNGRHEPRVAFDYRAPGALSRACGKTQSDGTLNLNDSTPFEHAPRSTSDIFEHQSEGAFVPADTAGTSVWGGGGGRARGSWRVLIWTVDMGIWRRIVQEIRLCGVLFSTFLYTAARFEKWKGHVVWSAAIAA
ncbi:hypothetical protein C8J57DRAFT_1581334 [Mycena rebaudengoi]|nr:hypothetical protein C8J57DRAFT_1581334 [Mycena rebaudengoi]